MTLTTSLVSMGAYSKNVEYITEKLRAKNIKVGSIRLRYFRPFPADELRKACENAKAVGSRRFLIQLWLTILW